MKKIKYLIPLIIIIFVITLINIFPKKATAELTYKQELHENHYEGSLRVETYWLYTELTNDNFNYSKITLNLKNLNVTEVKALNDFKVLSENNLTYEFGSNTTHHNGRVYFASFTVKQIDSGSCSFGYSPEAHKLIKTNNFTLDKTANKTDIYAGDTFTYTITVTPNLDMDSDNVTVTDVIPSELEILDAHGGEVSGQTITWNLGTFTKTSPAKTLTVDVKARASTKGQVKNTATLKVGDKSLEDSVYVNILYSDISITKTASKTSVSNDEEFYYDLLITNNGTGTSKNITVKDTLDSNLIFLRSDTEYTNEGNTYTFNIGALASNSSKKIRIYVKLKSTNKESSILNTAIATEEGKEPKEDEVTVNVLKPNLVLEKTANLSSVPRGSIFTYQIKITNTGLGIALNVKISDTINSNFTIESVSDGTYSGNDFTITYAKLNPNESKMVTITVKVKDTAPLGSILNTAIATSDNHEDVTDNTPVTITDYLIEIKKEASKQELTINEEFTYTITVTNNGDAIATNLVVRDVIDEHLEILDSNGASQNGNTLSWNIPLLNNGSKVSYTIKVKVKNIPTDTYTIPNIASVTIPNRPSIEDEVDVVVKKPSFNLTKYAIKSIPRNNVHDRSLELKTIRPNEEYYYEIRVENTSDVLAKSVTISDTLNNLLTIIDSANGKINNNTITWTIDLNPHETKVFYIRVKVSKEASINTVIPNIVTLKHNDTTLEDDVSTKVIDIDIYLLKEASVKEVKKNDTFYYTLTIGNAGNLDVSNLTIKDIIPDKLEYIKIELPENITYTYDLNTLNINIPNLKASAEIELKIYVKVKSNVTKDEKIKNTATLTYEDKTLEDSDTVTVLDTLLTIKKTTSVKNIINDEEFYYTIVITNEGDIPALNLTVTDNFDERLTILDSSSGTIKDHSITWNIPLLNKKSSITYTIKAKVSNATPGDIIKNVAILEEPDKPKQEVEVTNPVTSYNINITKEVDKKEVTKNEEFTYTIKVTNDSDYEAKNVLVSDNISEFLTIINTTGTVNNNNISWTLNLKAHEAITLKVVVKVKENTPNGKIPNVAILNFNGKETPSNEVLIEVVDIKNPQTGSIISYLALFLGIIIALISFRYVNKKRKFYRI